MTFLGYLAASVFLYHNFEAPFSRDSPLTNLLFELRKILSETNFLQLYCFGHSVRKKEPSRKGMPRRLTWDVSSLPQIVRKTLIDSGNTIATTNKTKDWVVQLMCFWTTSQNEQAQASDLYHRKLRRLGYSLSQMCLEGKSSTLNSQGIPWRIFVLSVVKLSITRVLSIWMCCMIKSSPIKRTDYSMRLWKTIWLNFPRLSLGEGR